MISVNGWLLDQIDLNDIKRDFGAFVVRGDGSFDWPVDVLVLCPEQDQALDVTSHLTEVDILTHMDDGLPFREPQSPEDRGWKDFLELVGMTEAAMMADIQALQNTGWRFSYVDERVDR